MAGQQQGISREELSVELNQEFDELINSTDANNTLLNNKVDKVTGKSLISDTEITRLAEVSNFDSTAIIASITALNSGKLDKSTYNGTAQDLYNLIINATTGVTGKSVVPTDTPTGTGVASWIAVQNGTYTNFGGLVLPVNSVGVISRSATNVYSISYTAFSVPTSKTESWVAQAYSIDTERTYLGKLWRSNTSVVSTDIPGTSSKWVEVFIGYNQTTTNIPIKNLYDKSKNSFGYIGTNGDVNNSGSALVSALIPVDPDTDYYISGRVSSQDSATKGVVYYDVNKVKIAQAPQGANHLAGLLNGVYRTSATTYYMRLCVRYSAESFDLVQVEKGTTVTSFSSYSEAISKINNTEIIGKYILDEGVLKTISQILANYTNKTYVDDSIKLTDDKVAYLQDNRDYNLSKVVNNDWYIAPDASNYIVETDTFLNNLGITKSLRLPYGQGMTPTNSSRAILYIYNYGYVLDGKYVQFGFYLRTDNIAAVNFNIAQIFCSGTNNSPVGFVSGSDEKVVTNISGDLYFVRISARIPLTGNITKVWIGGNIGTATGTSPEITISGFYTYVSNTILNGKLVVATVKPKVYKEIELSNSELLAEINRQASLNIIYYRNHNLYGKKWHIIGDSISADQTNSYPYLLANKFSMIKGNYAISGTKLGGADANSMVNRFSTMTDDADYITVAGGTNDKIQSLPIGTITDNVNTTFYGSLNLLCQGLIDKYPTKKIGFITPMQTTTNDGTLPYVDAIIAVCAKYSIPVLDLYRKGGFSRQSSQGTALYPDFTHPNAIGHLKLRDKVEAFLLTL